MREYIGSCNLTRSVGRIASVLLQKVFGASKRPSVVSFMRLWTDSRSNIIANYRGLYTSPDCDYAPISLGQFVKVSPWVLSWDRRAYEEFPLRSRREPRESAFELQACVREICNSRNDGEEAHRYRHVVRSDVGLLEHEQESREGPRSR